MEVSARHKWRAQNALLKLYGRTIKGNDQYPNGVRLRFVCPRKDGINKAEKSKMDKLRHRQKEFLESIKSSTTTDFFQLDYSPCQGEIPTLRQMIMSLNSKREGNIPLFHCVDLDWRMDGFTFQYSPQVADEAETTINTLLPLLQHFYPAASVENSFNEETIDRCRHMSWDDDRKMIVDRMIEDETEDLEEEENLVGFTFDKAALDELQRPARAPMPHDDDSVSTFRPANQNLVSRESASSRTVTSNDTSSLTTTTDQEVIRQLDNRLNGLASQLIVQQNKQQEQFHSLLQALSQQPSQTSEEASSSINSGSQP